ncbi:hypothetical protein ABZW11_17360 [Nonomuraea sp. NPDC004580]
MTNAEMEAALATLDEAMRAGARVAPADRPCLVRKGCTCPSCKPGGKR